MSLSLRKSLGRRVRSLRVRVAVGMLSGMLAALWGTTLLLGYFLRQELEASLSAQQYSVVTLLADDIEHSVVGRSKVLEVVAAGIDAAKLAKPALLDAEMRQQPVLQTLFNWGILITDREGTTLVSLPDELGRRGVNYLDVPAVREAIDSGRTRIGPALIGKTTHQPVFPMIVPILAADGRVLGTVIGLTNLAIPNFLDDISANRFGRRGGYLVTDPAQRIFIAATDKTRVMQAGPPPGLNPIYDRYLAGFEGSGVARSSRGVVELSSSRRVPSTGWLMQAVLPTDEAFAPIDALEARLLAASVMLTVLAGGLGWWWLRREMRALGEAARLLGAMRDGEIPRQALPVRRDDEIGALAGAFNGLLTTIEEGEARAAEHSFNQRLRAIVSQIPGVVFQYRIAADGRHSLPFASDALVELCGVAPESLRDNVDALLEVIAPADPQAFLAGLRTAADRAGPWQYECRIAHPQRGWRWLRVEALPEREADGTLIWHGFASDVTAIKDIESELRIAAATFETQQGIFITDAQQRIVRVNHAFTEMTGYTAADAIGHPPSLLKSARHGPEFYQRLYAGLARDGFWQGEIWNRRKNGEVFAEWVTISTVRDPAGQPTHYVAAFSDITENKKAEERIHQLAFYDPLTDLPNRRLFHDRLEQALVGSARTGQRGALLFLDLDGFKRLNDSYGHIFGDALLIDVARRLGNSVRAADTVARLGGDEFVVILENLDDADGDALGSACRVAAKLRAILAEPYVLSTPGSSERVCHQCSASIGVCVFSGQEESCDELIKRADIAMYEAKAAGRNTVRAYEAPPPHEAATVA